MSSRIPFAVSGWVGRDTCGDLASAAPRPPRGPVASISPQPLGLPPLPYGQGQDHTLSCHTATKSLRAPWAVHRSRHQVSEPKSVSERGGMLLAAVLIPLTCGFTLMPLSLLSYPS